MKNFIVISLFLLIVGTASAQNGSLSPYQKSILDYWYIGKTTNSIEGAWIKDGTILAPKLSTNIQSILSYAITNAAWRNSDSNYVYITPDNVIDITFDSVEDDPIWSAVSNQVQTDILQNATDIGLNSATGAVHTVQISNLTTTQSVHTAQIASLDTWQANQNANTYSLTNVANVTMTNGATLNNPYGFSALKSADQTIAGSTFVLITWDGTEYNVGNCFNTTNSTFTATVSGRYFFSLSARFINIVDAGIAQLSFYTNGVFHKGARHGSPNDAFDPQPVVPIEIYLNAGDTVTTYAYHSDSTADIKETSSGATWYTGTYMGE